MGPHGSGGFMVQQGNCHDTQVTLPGNRGGHLRYLSDFSRNIGSKWVLYGSSGFLVEKVDYHDNQVTSGGN